MLVGFGLLSLAVAVPFLWQPMAWKRLLAYSSLEHMGVIALGIGFGTPLALAGVAVHVVGHALAKALGFYAATPLLGHEPRAAGHAVRGIGRTQGPLGSALGISLGALAGLPPSPLFASEVLIVAGGFAAGRPWTAAAAAALLALGFLGLAHTLIETVAGKAPARDRTAPGLRGVVLLDERRRPLPARAHRRGVVAARQRNRARARAGDLDERTATASPSRSTTAAASPACTRTAAAPSARCSSRPTARCGSSPSP